MEFASGSGFRTRLVRGAWFTRFLVGLDRNVGAKIIFPFFRVLDFAPLHIREWIKLLPGEIMSAPHIHLTIGVLHDYLLGKLPESDCDAIESHLAVCPACETRAAAARPDDALATVLESLGCGLDAALTPTPGDTPLGYAPVLSWNGLRGRSPDQNELGTASLNGSSGPAFASGAGSLPRYRLIREIGRGGMGEVWLAEDTSMRRLVALKKIRPDLVAHPEAVGRFRREIEALAAINDPNVVRAYDTGEDRGVHFLVMEYVDGETLAEVVKRGPLSVEDACRYTRDAARGLHAAHTAGLFHRDVKPSNLILEKNGVVKVSDFGLALCGDATSLSCADGLTGPKEVFGTPDYISPEQAVDSHTADARSDIYSLGCTLYHLLIGHPPFHDRAPHGKLVAHQTSEPAPIPALSRALVTVLAKMMAKEPGDRYQTAAEVASALEPFATAVGPIGKATIRRPVWRRAVAVALLLSTITVAAVVIFKTERGVLVVEVDGEADLRFKDGELLILDADANVKYRLRPGDRNTALPAGRYTVKVIGADGLSLDTPEFTMTKAGTVTIRVSAKPSDPAGPIPKGPITPNAPSPDRSAAIRMLAVPGGRVCVNGEDREIKAATDLPASAFRLSSINLNGSATVSDADLRALSGCKHLTHVNLGHTGVGDEGVVALKECTGITYLDLYGTRVTDAGIETFKDCKELTYLQLGDTKVTSDGLAHLRDCNRLTWVSVNHSQVSDVRVFASHKRMKLLNLEGTSVTDAGLDELKDHKALTELQVRNTSVTAEGVGGLAKAIPRCKIVWDGGVVSPK